MTRRIWHGYMWQRTQKVRSCGSIKGVFHPARADFERRVNCLYDKVNQTIAIAPFLKIIENSSTFLCKIPMKSRKAHGHNREVWSIIDVVVIHTPWASQVIKIYDIL